MVVLFTHIYIHVRPLFSLGCALPPIVSGVSAVATSLHCTLCMYDIRFVRSIHETYAYGTRTEMAASPARTASTGLTFETIVDIDDLDDQKILTRIATSKSLSTSRAASLRQALTSHFWRFEARRWQSLHRRIDETSVPIVCSEIDATRSGLKHVRVVANGYKRPDQPVGRIELNEKPTVMFQGTLRYPPNADAARFLISKVTPHLASLVPEVQIRLVGIVPPSFAVEVHPSVVTVVGPVDDMAGELARADLVVVPLRYGSGTRIKILEAFAHRIPVVSTSLGAEGLEVEDGVHLLLADDPVAIARACSVLLSNVSLRQTIADNAHALFLERYESGVVQDAIRQVVHDVEKAATSDAAVTDAKSPIRLLRHRQPRKRSRTNTFHK